MSIQRRLYEKMAGLNQEKDIQEGPAHQNPLKTTFGGMKDAKNTPSMKAYYAQVKKDQASRAVKTAAEREKERLARRESVDLDEKLQFKLKTKFKPSTARGSGTKKERMTIYDVIIDGVRVGMLEKEVSQDFNYGEGGSYMTFKILQPGSRNKYAEKILVDDVEDPNDFFKQLKKNPRTAKRTIKALKAHGVELTGLDSKHESVDLDELKQSTLRSYKDKAKKSERSGRDTGFEGETPSEREAGVRQVKKRVKGIDGATKRLVARQYEDVEQVDELKLPSKDAKGNFKSNKVRRAFTKGAVKAQDASNKAMDKATSRGSDIDNTIKHIDRSLDADGRRDDRKRKARKEEVERIDELSPKTLKSYIWKAKGKVQSDLNTGNHSPKTNKRAKNVVKAMGRVGEAIKFDAGHPDSGISGTVSGKGKRNRKAGGEVRVKYKGHPAYKDDSPGLPIKAREIGRLIKTARKKDTKPHDSKNLTNPAVTRDPNGAGVRGGGVRKVRKEGAYAFATKVTDKFNKALDNKTKGFEKRVDDKFNKPAKTKLGKLGQKLFNSVEYTDEGMSDMTPSQERDADRRLKPTRATVSKVRLRAGEKDIAKSVKAHQSEKGGKPGNTKQRKLRDLMLKGRTRTEDVEVTESEVNRKDLRYKRTKVTDAAERARRDRERESNAHERDKARSTTEELLNVAEDMVTEAKDSYEVVAVKGNKVVAKMPAEKMDIKDAVAALTKMHGGSEVQVHKNGKIVKMKG